MTGLNSASVRVVLSDVCASGGDWNETAKLLEAATGKRMFAYRCVIAAQTLPDEVVAKIVESGVPNSYQLSFLLFHLHRYGPSAYPPPLSHRIPGKSLHLRRHMAFVVALLDLTRLHLDDMLSAQKFAEAGNFQFQNNTVQ